MSACDVTTAVPWPLWELHGDHPLHPRRPLYVTGEVLQIIYPDTYRNSWVKLAH